MSNIVTPQRKPFARPGVMSTWNWALEFDGEDDYVEVDKSNEIFASNPSAFTIETWVKPSSVSEEYIYETHDANEDWTTSFRFEDSNEVRFYLDIEGGRSDLFTSYSTTLDEWMHVALVWEQDTKVEIFVDGELIDSSVPEEGSLANDFYGIIIGADRSKGRNLDCKLNDFRLWSIARTQQEIQDNMNKKLTGNETGLVAYYPMNEGEGTTVYDESTNSNDGTIEGATWAKGNYLRRSIL